jgi:DNA invertase Pin-like site-specific DNA recombinase
MGRAFLTNAATYAELERNLISERTKEALYQIKLQGGVLGAISYGWERTDEVDSFGRRVLRANPVELETIGMCKALRDQGFTLQQIADKFNREGIPTKKGGRWFPSTVRNYCSKGDK